jgi:hypothetical protein
MIKEVAWSFLRRIARTSPLPAEQYFSNYPEVREQIGQRASVDEHHLNDLRFLHRYVRKHRPRIILEIGCGDSTIVTAMEIATGMVMGIGTAMVAAGGMVAGMVGAAHAGRGVHR